MKISEFKEVIRAATSYNGKRYMTEFGWDSPPLSIASTHTTSENMPIPQKYEHTVTFAITSKVISSQDLPSSTSDAIADQFWKYLYGDIENLAYELRHVVRYGDREETIKAVDKLFDIIKGA